MGARPRGAAILWPTPVVIVGPSGVGKTGVLLAAVSAGAVPVDGEEVHVAEGEVRAATGRVRLRARHLREARWAADGLGRLDRARLRAAGALVPIPALGSRIGRRVFVDAPLAAIAPAVPLGGGDVTFVVLLPPGSGPSEPGQLGGTDANDALRPHLDGEPAVPPGSRVWSLTRGLDESDADVARRIGELVATADQGAA